MPKIRERNKFNSCFVCFGGKHFPGKRSSPFSVVWLNKGFKKGKLRWKRVFHPFINSFLQNLEEHYFPPLYHSQHLHFSLLSLKVFHQTKQRRTFVHLRFPWVYFFMKKPFSIKLNEVSHQNFPKSEAFILTLRNFPNLTKIRY